MRIIITCTYIKSTAKLPINKDKFLNNPINNLDKTKEIKVPKPPLINRSLLLGALNCRVDKFGIFRQEGHGNTADRAITLLSDDRFS